MSCAVLLCLEHPVGGFIGMSGFLTYQAELELAVGLGGDDDFDDDDPFARDSDSGGKKVEEDAVVKAQTFERDLMGLDDLKSTSKMTTAYSTPIFLGHGSEDEKVPCSLGMKLATALQAAEYDVVWKCYQGQGHRYKVPDEINDIVDFICTRVGWKC